MRAAHIVVVSGLALVACGGDDETRSTMPATAATVGVKVTAPATADGAGLTVAAVVPGTAPAVTEVAVSSSPATAPRSGASRCAVTITGAVSAAWMSDVSGPQAFVYGGWLTDPGPDDAGAFGLNCFDSDFNLVGFVASPDSEIPMEPATYEMTAPFDPAAPITAEVALLFDEGLWETTSGTLEILEFDEVHIRGRFALEIHDSFDETRTAEVAGEFAHSR